MLAFIRTFLKIGGHLRSKWMRKSAGLPNNPLGLTGRPLSFQPPSPSHGMLSILTITSVLSLAFSLFLFRIRFSCFSASSTYHLGCLDISLKNYLWSSICGFQGTWGIKFSMLSFFYVTLDTEWRWRDSNSWPPACKAGALPTELHPHGCGSSLKVMRQSQTYSFVSFVFPLLKCSALKQWA